MARFTKSEIESELLRGNEFGWGDAKGKKQKLRLVSAASRRLFKHLLETSVRKPTELPEDFIKGVAAALNDDTDPAEDVAPQAISGDKTSWRLHSIETEGVGGVNVFGGPVFTYDFDGKSWLTEGPNGSGKSSLLGAITWAMTASRPREFSDVQANEARPVFTGAGDGSTENEVGQWPPFAAFPSDVNALKTVPKASVILHFQDLDGQKAKVTRTLESDVVKGSRSTNLDVPPILVETGLLMPARLASMRFGDGNSQLAASVQRLTGLDDLISIGALCDGLCNKGREYLSYKKKELAAFKRDFGDELSVVKSELKKIGHAFKEYETKDTDDIGGELALIGKELSEKSTELTKVVSDDLMPGLDLSLPVNQQEVAAAIISAKQDVAEGIDSLPLWKNLDLIAAEVDDETLVRIDDAIKTAKMSAHEALELFRKTETDTKFQLKAVAAAWHAAHDDGEFDKCPLCAKLLDQPDLRSELVALQSAGEAASRTFTDNERAIVEKLTMTLPPLLRTTQQQVLQASPRAGLILALRSKFAANPKHSGKLAKFATLVEAALEIAPKSEFEPTTPGDVDPKLKVIYERIEACERLVELRSWFIAVKSEWETWWDRLVTIPEADKVGSDKEPSDSGPGDENWTEHLSRLSEALAKAEPYRLGAAAMRRAWRHGKDAREIEVELATRQDVANAIEPLKSLGSLAESEVREAIAGLSTRMETILDRTLISDKVRFQAAKFTKKEGVSVRASVNDNMLIDANLVANASWMRAVLWAFVFALREEAVEQMGADQFPVMVLDDPQATFDDQHRHRWSQQISSLQHGPGAVQVILATHDRGFLDLITLSGVTGRTTLLSSAGADTGHIAIYDGEHLDKLWAKADETKLDVDGRAYVSAARVQVETILRIMLRGEEANVSAVASGFVLGDCRAKLEWLHSKGKSPWDKGPFPKLAAALQKNIVAIKHMEMSHHAGAINLGMAEAIDVRDHMKKTLVPALEDAFRTQREHFRLHGGLTRLHAAAAVLPLPEGHSAEVKKIPLRILGRAAALTDGKLADGMIEMDDYGEANVKKITLAQHSAYRLLSGTLEPVANIGDILIVKEGAKATANSFVVATTEQKIFARRLEFAENHSDVIVLIAQANNPRKIAAPVIAQQSTFELRKVVGVIYDDHHFVAGSSGNEVGEIGGTSALSHLLSGKLGLVEIVGDSAEPIALDGQFIVVTDPLSQAENFAGFSGKPVIVEDREGHRYFKRLQTTSEGSIVLESLDASGEHGPIIMHSPGDDELDQNVIVRIWPVAGILFEIPN